MNLQKKDIFFNLDLGETFDEFSQIIQNAISVFWEVDSTVKLISLSNFDDLKQEFIARDSDFFTTQIKVENAKPFKVRLDTNFAEEFLTDTLEDSGYAFELA